VKKVCECCRETDGDIKVAWDQVRGAWKKGRGGRVFKFCIPKVGLRRSSYEVRVLRNMGEIRKCGVNAILREKFEIFLIF
jgi:hypothetical protein